MVRELVAPQRRPRNAALMLVSMMHVGLLVRVMFIVLQGCVAIRRLIPALLRSSMVRGARATASVRVGSVWMVFVVSQAVAVRVRLVFNRRPVRRTVSVEQFALVTTTIMSVQIAAAAVTSGLPTVHRPAAIVLAALRPRRAVVSINATTRRRRAVRAALRIRTVSLRLQLALAEYVLPTKRLVLGTRASVSMRWVQPT